MPRLTGSLPKYRRHKASGQAIVTLDGQDRYLGPHGTQASRLEYDRLIAEWLAGGRRVTPPAANGGAAAVTVVEVLAAYWEHALAYYRRPDGTPTSVVETLRHALAPLRRLFGRTPAAEFGPLRLKAVRQAMVELRYCRSYVNKQVSRVKQASVGRAVGRKSEDVRRVLVDAGASGNPLHVRAPPARPGRPGTARGHTPGGSGTDGRRRRTGVALCE